MGYGDEIMATGLARGFFEKGKLAAFGDGKKIIWGPYCNEMFENNPNIARPGLEQSRHIEWIPHYKGSRLYNKLVNGKWEWNYDFKAVPGEFFFDERERAIIDRAASGHIVIEPNLPWQKSVWPNKDWGEEKYCDLSKRLSRSGFKIMQFVHKNSKRILRDAFQIKQSVRFRDVVGVLSKQALYIGPEGGMHHAAAAVGIPAVVLMGGFIPPSIVGYADHVNLTGGVEACGSIVACDHCKRAMQGISVDEVFTKATERLCNN